MPGSESSDRYRQQEREIEDLKQRVAELEKIIDRELGYSLRHPIEVEPQTVDCTCGESFEITIETGLTCPHCGAGSEDRLEQKRAES